MEFLCFQTPAGTEMRCHDITIQKQSETTSLKKKKKKREREKEEQMLANSSSSGISWAHIIKLQGGYFGKNRI
jgi:hypothetical protein